MWFNSILHKKPSYFIKLINYKRVNVIYQIFDKKMSIVVTIQWNEEVDEKLKKLSENDLLAAKNKMLLTAAILLQWEAKKLVPIDTWMLRRSISYRIYWDHAQVYSIVPYAVYVHEWTKPHLITAVKKKSLYWGKDWVWYFTKSVIHPWIKANPFFENAAKNCKDEIIKRCNDILQSVIDNL